MTDAELQLANDAYDEMDSIFAKANALRQNLAYNQPVSAPEYVAYAEDIHVAVGYTLGLLGRLINQLEGRPEE